MKNSLRLVILTLAAALVAQSAFAYNWNKCRSNKQTWDSNNVTFQPSSVSFPAGSQWRASVESMRTAWNFAPGTRFDFTYNYRNSSLYSSGDDRNSILITGNYGWDGGVVGVAIRRHKWCVWPFWGGKLKEVDVLFNPDRTWDTATNPEEWVDGLNSTLVGIHELGHAMGLDHEDDVIATMNSFVPNGGPIGRDNDAVPHGDDVLGNRAGYGTSGSPRDIYASMYERTGAGRSDNIDSGPFNVFQNTPTAFEFTIGNRGVVNETSVGVKFYLSADRNITTGDILVGSAGYSLNSGVTLNRTLNITIPSSVPSGFYHFGYIVDPENYIPEVDEGNNSVAYTFPLFVRDQTPPRACFSVSPTSGNGPLLVTVNASCSSDPDGSTR